MQWEIYTVEPFGTPGEQKMDYEKPEYFLFNGSVGALTRAYPLYANVGETVRSFFGVGGPNVTSVPPGGATIVNFKIDRRGGYTLVDHVLSRSERGLVGFLDMACPEDRATMHKGPAKYCSHRMDIVGWLVRTTAWRLLKFHRQKSAAN